MVQSLDRGIRILEILEWKKSAGVTELAIDLGINKSTAYRLLYTLRNKNLIEQNEDTDKYCLCAGILRLGNSMLKNTTAISQARPYLEELSKITKESAHLSVFTNMRVVVVDQVMSLEAIKVTASIGREEYIHCSSLGKATLAYQPEDVQENILNNITLEKITDKTITDKQELIDQLFVISTQGYAIDDEEMAPGVRCIAAPIIDNRGVVKYCVGISGPTNRMKTELLQDYAAKVKSTAEKIAVEREFFIL